MCWFIVDPKTGEYGEHVKTPSRGDTNTLYLHGLAFDSFFDIRWAFELFLAPHPRPPFEDLVAFVVDGWIPESFHFLMGPELGQHHQAIQDFWKSWDNGDDGYLAVIGRPMLRAEKYWLVEHLLRRLAVGREQFYEGKALTREEWLVDWRSWDGVRWKDVRWARVRVFSDGTADAWCRGLGLMGYDTEEDARRELEAAGYSAWEELEDRHFLGAVPPPPAPPQGQEDDKAAPFRYRKEY